MKYRRQWMMLGNAKSSSCSIPSVFRSVIRQLISTQTVSWLLKDFLKKSLASSSCTSFLEILLLSMIFLPMKSMISQVSISETNHCQLMNSQIFFKGTSPMLQQIQRAPKEASHLERSPWMSRQSRMAMKMLLMSLRQSLSSIGVRSEVSWRGCRGAGWSRGSSESLSRSINVGLFMARMIIVQLPMVASNIQYLKGLTHI